MSVEEGWKASRTYESVVSIGAQCMTSTLLKSTGLKRYSGPFDWIFSNLRMVCDCLEDDFATLLDRQYLVPVPPALRHSQDSCFADHRFYQRRYGLNTMFNHYDPTDEAGYGYLERCVERFRAALTSNQRHLLLAIVERHQGGLYGFERLCRILEAYRSIEALILVSPDERAARGLELWKERGRHRLIFFHTPSHVSGIHFEQEEDNVFARETLREMIVVEPAAASR